MGFSPQVSVRLSRISTGPFVSLKMTYRKMFSEFSGVCFTENKWSTENIFLVNEKSSHFSVKCLTDFKSVKHFTEKNKKNFSSKIFSRKSFFRKHFPVSRFTRTKRSLRIIIISKPYILNDIRSM